MRSTRSRENGSRKQKSNLDVKKEREEEEEEKETNATTHNEQSQPSQFSTSSTGEKRQVSNNKWTSSEGNSAGLQLLEQQKKRIEQLEKDLHDSRLEIERLRLYNRQLALSLTSIHRRGLEGSNYENYSTSFVQQSSLPFQHGSSDSSTVPMDASVAFGSPRNNDGTSRTSTYNNQEQQESWDSTNKQEKKTQSRYWTAEEHMRFLEGLARFGHKDMKAIARFVGTRNATQVRTHAQKYYLKLAREAAKRQEQQHSHFGSGVASEERRGCTSAPVTPLCRTSSFKSARQENEGVSSSYLDSNGVKRTNWFANPGVFHTMCLDQDSSGGEMSTASEGNSEPKSLSKDRMHSNQCRTGANEHLLESDKSPLYVDLYQQKQERDTSGSFLGLSLVEEKAGIDSQFDSFSLHHRNNSLNVLGELHDEHFTEFENFPKFHSFPEKSIGNLSSSGNSLMEFDDSQEVARAMLESE